MAPSVPLREESMDQRNCFLEELVDLGAMALAEFRKQDHAH
jgi:hypothetical protein